MWIIPFPTTTGSEFESCLSICNPNIDFFFVSIDLKYMIWRIICAAAVEKIKHQYSIKQLTGVAKYFWQKFTENIFFLRWTKTHTISLNI